MDYKEAIEWFEGKRSMTNLMTSRLTTTIEEQIVCIAEANAAMMQQAYWFLKASKEGLLQANESYGTCGFCNNDGMITKDPIGLMCDRCWDKQQREEIIK